MTRRCVQLLCLSVYLFKILRDIFVKMKDLPKASPLKNIKTHSANILGCIVLVYSL